MNSQNLDVHLLVSYLENEDVEKVESTSKMRIYSKVKLRNSGFVLYYINESDIIVVKGNFLDLLKDSSETMDKDIVNEEQLEFFLFKTEFFTIFNFYYYLLLFVILN
jgi:hypothetical protein